MSRNHLKLPFALFFCAFLLAAAPSMAGWGDALKSAGDAGAKSLGLSVSPSQAEQGLRELLVMGTDAAVVQLSADGGFSKRAATALSLPDSYQKLAETVAPQLLDSLNKAAESAVPAVGEVFKKTISTMEFADPTSLISGKKDAVTRYFEESARVSLAENTAPLMQAALEEYGAGSALSAIRQLSSLTGVEFDPVGYLTDKTLDSMFLYIAKTEKGVRSGDIETTSELLNKLF